MFTNILIVDPFSDRIYTNDTIDDSFNELHIKIIMLLNGLVEKENINIYFAQKKITSTIKAKENLSYISIDQSKNLDKDDIEYVIVMFSPEKTKEYSNIYMDTTVYLWLFDFAQKTLLAVTPKEELQEMYNPIIVSSLWQGQNISDFLEEKDVNLPIIILPFFVTLFINDVKEYPILPLSNENKDINKLLFVNDSYKGLSKTISVFKKVRKVLPELTLYVINEEEEKEDDENNIVYLGKLKRNDVLFHMRKSLCLLHVNDVYPESFGFSHITANLLRTPVIAYNNGALSENLELENSQLINCRSPAIVVKKIKYLQSHNVDEKIDRSNNYSKQNVVDQWCDFLGM